MIPRQPLISRATVLFISSPANGNSVCGARTCSTETLSTSAPYRPPWRTKGTESALNLTGSPERHTDFGKNSTTVKR